MTPRDGSYEEEPCQVCGCRGEAYQGRYRFECDGIAEAHEAEGARGERERILKLIEAERAQWETEFLKATIPACDEVVAALRAERGTR